MLFSVLFIHLRLLSFSANPMPMAFHRPTNPKPKPRSQILFFTLAIAAIALLYLFSTLMSTSGFSFSSSSKTLNIVFNPNNRNSHERIHKGHEKYLYWGDRIDCPGKHCDSCEGLGHQESSLRCALEEAMFLKRCVLLSVLVLGFVFVLCFIAGFGVLCPVWFLRKCGKRDCYDVGKQTFAKIFF